MSNTTGIPLSIDITKLLLDVDSAIKKVNDKIRKTNIEKIKINADTSELESAIKRIKSELASIAGRNSTPRIELGTSRADGQITLDELTAFRKAEEALANPVGMAAVQAEFNKTAEIVKSLTSAVSVLKTEYSSIGGVNSAGNTGGLIDANAISERIKTAVLGLNITKPVEIPIAFKGVQEAVAALQQQVNGTVINIGNTALNGASTSAGETVSNAVKRAAEQATEALKQQSQAERELETAMKSLNEISNDFALYKNKGNADVSALFGKAEKLKSVYELLQKAFAADTSPKALESLKQWIAELSPEVSALNDKAEELAVSFGKVKIDDNNLKKVNQLIAQMEEYMRRNPTAMTKTNAATGNTFGDDIRAFISQLQDAGNIGDAECQKIANGFANIKYQIKAANLEGNTFLGELKEKATKFIKWTAMTLVITKARMYFRQLFTTVYDLDTALVDLKKTFNGTAKELENFYYESNKLAKQMGITTAEAIKLGSAWSRLGYSSNEKMKKMAEMSAMFAAISPDMNSEQAQNGLVAIMKAFDIDPDNVLDEILSKVNIIGNTAATSNGEIVEILEKSSAAMRAANNTLEETIALGTAGVEILRDSSKIGNSLKTISMRLRGYSEETEAYTEDVEELSGKIADLTKTASKPGGISLFSDANKTTYKSTYQILKEVSEIWDELDDKDQAALQEAIGGKHQGNVVAAIAQNFEAAEKALDNMANSAGSAEAELATYQESAEYLFNQFKETFTGIAQNAIKRDDLKDLIKFGTSMLEIVDDIVSNIGLLPAILTTVVGIISSKKAIQHNFLGFNMDNGKFGMKFLGAQVGEGWWGNVTGKTQRAEIQNDIKAVNDFHAEMQKGVVTSKTYNAAMNSSNAAVRDFAAAEMAGKTTTESYQATLATLEAELQQTGIKGKLAAVGLKAAEVGVKALNAAISIGISLLVSYVLNALMSGFNKAVHSIDNHLSKLKELTSEYESLKTEIESLNKELVDTKKKIEKLEKLPKPTFLQKEELEALQAYNDKLERQIKLKENELISNTSERNKEAQNTWDEMTTVKSGFHWKYLIPFYGQFEAIKDAVSDIENYKNNKNWELQMLYLEQYKETLEEIKKLEEDDSYLADNPSRESILEQYKKDADELKTLLMDAYGQWNDLIANLDADDPQNKEAIELLQGIIEEWDVLSGKIKIRLEDILDTAEFSVVKQYLIDLAEKGELTAEAFEELSESDVKGIDDFRKALENVEDLTIDDVIESIVVSIEDLEDELDKGTKSVTEFTKALEKLKEIVSKQETLADAFKKIRINGFLSPQEARELLDDFPTLIEYLEQTADGYAISAENIKAANAEIIKSEKDKLSTQIVTAETQILELEKLNKLALELDNSDGQDTELIDKYNAQREKTEELRKKLDVKSTGEISDGIAKLEEQLKKDRFQLDVLEKSFSGYTINDIYDDAKSAISDYNNEIKTLNSTIKTLNEGQTLSYEEMVGIVEIAPELEDFFDGQDGRYTIAAEKINEWVDKTYEARNKYINNCIEMAKADVQAQQDEIDTCERLLSVAQKFGDEADQLRAQIDLDAANEKMNAILGTIQKFEALQKDLTYDDNKGDDISDALQNQIDYYKTIISAIEIMRDKCSEAFEKEKEALENEKKALQEGKDALKEANDERQRELDLIEARNNLENAKKRKVWVYSDNGGFRQVQDEKAVKEAEEKYRDAITDVQEAEIDKKIKELDKKIEENEKQQEAFEKSLEDMTKLEQNIEDAKTVEQAKTALGLADENDLLNLSDAVKDGIKNGLAEAILAKDNEENKEKTDRNGNSLYTPVTLDDVLKSLGATVTAEDLKAMKSELPTEAVYNAAVKGFTDSLKEFTDKAVQNVTNNNNGMVISPTFNIYDASDPNKIADVVDDKITDLLTRYNNSIK